MNKAELIEAMVSRTGYSKKTTAFKAGKALKELVNK